MLYPPSFSQTIQEVFRERGAAWLVKLPELIVECEQRWGMKVLPPYDLSYNYVAPAVMSDGMDVVLKLGVPNPELLSEMAALNLYDGRGCTRLIDCDPERGIIIEERLLPGTPLGKTDDDELITEVIAQTMQQLWRPVPADHHFHPLERWTGGLQRLRQTFNGGVGPFPQNLVERAERLLAELLASTTQTVLLHGDLHQWNILSSQRQPWLALDPKGLAGDPCFDTGTFFYNPPPDIFSIPYPEQVYERRIRQTAEILGFDTRRITDWGFTECVLSSWWSYEDHGHDWDSQLAVAEILLKVKLT